MNDCFVRYSPPMERTSAYGKHAPILDDRYQDEPVMMEAMSHPGRPRLSDPANAAHFAWPDRPAKTAEPTASLYEFATTTPPEKGAMHAAFPAGEGGLDMRLDGNFHLARDPSWNFTPELDLHNFSTFSAALSPYSSISPYVPAADLVAQHEHFVPQETYTSLPLDRHYSSLSSSASSSSIASSLGYDRQSPVESATSCGSSNSARFSNPLALTAIHDGKAGPPSRPDSAQQSKKVTTIKTEEDLNDYFDHLFKKTHGDDATSTGSSRSRQVSADDSSTPLSGDRVKPEPLGEPIPLFAPSPIQGRAMRPAVLARQHSLQHTFNGRPRSDSTFSTSSFDSNASSLYGLHSPLGALALSESSSSQGYFAPQPIRTVHPLAISAGPSSPASPASLALPLRASTNSSMVAPPMGASMSMSALPPSKLGNAPPLTPRLRALQASEGVFASPTQDGEDPSSTQEPHSAGRPRAFSNPTAPSTGGSSRVGRTRHSRNGSVVLAAAGRQVQSALGVDEEEAGNETLVKRRRSTRVSPTLSSVSAMTPPGSPAAAAFSSSQLLGSPISVADVTTTPGGTVRLRRGSGRRTTGGLMDSVMARSESTPTLSAMATASISGSSALMSPTRSAGEGTVNLKSFSPRSRARMSALTAVTPAAPPSPTSSLRRANSLARTDSDDGNSPPGEDEEQIQQDGEGRLICGMLLPGMTEPCQRAFKRKEHRKRHQRQHTNEKPYPCPKCGMRFTRTDNCNQHIRTHENKDGRNSKMLRARQERESRGLVAFANAQVLASSASSTSSGSTVLPPSTLERSQTVDPNSLLMQQHQAHSQAFSQQQHHLAMAQAAMAAGDHDAAYWHHEAAQKVEVEFREATSAFEARMGMGMGGGAGAMMVEG